MGRWGWKKHIIGLIIWLCLGNCVLAKEPSEIPGYQLTEDGGAWTIYEPVVNSKGEPIEVVANNPYMARYGMLECWTPYGTQERVRQNPLFEKVLEAGQHFYSYLRPQGKIPVYKWICSWEPANCQHSNIVNNQVQRIFHGMQTGGVRCGKAYYSGWYPYCSDCGKVVVLLYHYLSRSTVKQIDLLDTTLDYYYLCPQADCRGMEQGSIYGKHICQALSMNKYKIEYHYDDGNVRGMLSPSFHMYNNAPVYHGEPAADTQTHLNKVNGVRIGASGEKSDALVRPGYRFIGWSDQPGGTVIYEDGQEIYNLSQENYDGTAGVVHLYAVWEKAVITLKVDPNGGLYDGEANEMLYSLGYQEEQTIQAKKLTAPEGYTVSFESQGGTTIAPMHTQQKFLLWKECSGYGTFLNNGENVTYIANASAGAVDIIRAEYGDGQIILPSPVRNNYLFCGWSLDKNGTQIVGMGGDSYTPRENTVLYAKWGQLRLDASPNYTANQGRGAADLEWKWQGSMTEAFFYIPFQKTKDGKEDRKQIYSRMEGGDWGENIGKRTYNTPGTYTLTIPSTGYYEIISQGAKGGDFYNQTSRTTYYGGKGGKIGARIFLKKGTVLTVFVGGAGDKTGGGFSGGGAGKSGKGSGGGGFSGVYIGNVPYVIAGGGGGASITNSGGAGGTENVMNTAGTGQAASAYANGASGGGGGYRGGKAGKYEEVYHTHTATCPYHKHSGSAAKGGGCYKSGKYGWKLCGTVRWRNGPCGWWWDEVYQRCIRCHGTNRNELVHKDAFCNTPSCSYYNDFCLGQWGNTEAQARQTGNWFRIDLEGMTDYYAGHHYVWTQLEWERNCGYTREGYLCGLEGVLEKYVSTQSTGGSNYAISESMVTLPSLAGVGAGNGYVSVQAMQIGLVDEELSVKGVSAEDLAAPYAPNEQSFSMKENKNSMEISFQRVSDRGSTYSYIVKAFHKKNGNYVAESEVSRNVTLKVGVEGYYYMIDSDKDTRIDGKPDGIKKTQEPNIVLEGVLYEKIRRGDKLWLHIMAADKNGNLSETVHIPIDGTMNIQKQVFTEALQISGWEGAEGKNVTASGTERTYYVRSDGKTPFSLEFCGYVSTVNGGNELPDVYQYIFEDGTEQAGVVLLRNADQGISSSSQMGKIPIKRGGMYKETVIAGNKGSIKLEFLAEDTLNGRQLQVYPKAGYGTDRGQVVYSSDSRDREETLTLIMDGIGPSILGWEMLEEWCSNVESKTDYQGQIILQDDGSGVEQFDIRIRAGDGTLLMQDSCREGEYSLKVKQEWKQTYGEILIEMTATDKVGNETRVEIQGCGFYLKASVTRVLAPHEPNFRQGESGWLNLVVSEKVDLVEVIFPRELTDKNPDLNCFVSFGEQLGEKRETLVFQIPLYVPEQEGYEVELYAYSQGERLNSEPEKCQFTVCGNVLEDLRTRLR